MGVHTPAVAPVVGGVPPALVGPRRSSAISSIIVTREDSPRFAVSTLTAYGTAPILERPSDDASTNTSTQTSVLLRTASAHWSGRLTENRPTSRAMF